MIRYAIAFAALLLATALGGQALYTAQKGSIRFTSDAPLETIQAESKALKGKIDASRHTFAFSVPISSFQGFNSPLQREHFNENYLESGTYPQATFTGKIIEAIDFSQDATHDIRAKGKLTVHGITQERIIRGKLTVKGRRLTAEAAFTVLLAEHQINIPRMVFQKIAEEIKVSVQMELEADE